MDRENKLAIKMSLIAILTFIFSISCAAPLDSTVIIKGYLITRYNKKEIKSHYEQRVRKTEGKTYAELIDLKQNYFFVPIQIGNNLNLSQPLFSSIVGKLNNLNRDTLFFVPRTKVSETYFSTLSGKNIDLSKQVNLFTDLEAVYPYYTSSSDDRYIYKCVYIEAEAHSFDLKNNSSNRFKLDIDIDAVNRKADKIAVYFLTRVLKYTPFIQIADFQTWFPYID